MLPATFRLRIDRAIIACAPGAEVAAILGVCFEAGAHPVDADPRFLEFLFAAKPDNEPAAGWETGWRHAALQGTWGELAEVT